MKSRSTAHFLFLPGGAVGAPHPRRIQADRIHAGGHEVVLLQRTRECANIPWLDLVVRVDEQQPSPNGRPDANVTRVRGIRHPERIDYVEVEHVGELGHDISGPIRGIVVDGHYFPRACIVLKGQRTKERVEQLFAVLEWHDDANCVRAQSREPEGGNSPIHRDSLSGEHFVEVFNKPFANRRHVHAAHR